MDEPRPRALAARDVDGLLHAVVADVGESLDLWSVDLWAFSGDADTLECRAYWCRDAAAALSGPAASVIRPAGSGAMDAPHPRSM